MALISTLNSLRQCIPRISILRNRTHMNISLNHSKNGSNTQIRLKSMFPKFAVNEASIKMKDNMPDRYNLIYRNTMSNYLLGAQIISVLSAGIVGLYVFYAETTMKDYEPRMLWWKEQAMPVDNEILVYTTAILAVSVALQYFIKKMPLRIYNYNDEKFVFVYYNVFPFFTKKCTCGPREIRKLASKTNPVLPWTDSRYDAHKSYGVILLDNFFKSPSEMSIMLGQQKRFVEKESEENEY